MTPHEQAYMAKFLVPIGGVIIWPTTEDLPYGFLECDGSAVSRTIYHHLFAAIGTVWGAGDGSTTFNLPSLTSWP